VIFNLPWELQAMAAVKEAEGAVASYEVNLKAIPDMPNGWEEGGGVLEGI